MSLLSEAIGLDSAPAQKEPPLLCLHCYYDKYIFTSFLVYVSAPNLVCKVFKGRDYLTQLYPTSGALCNNLYLVCTLTCALNCLFISYPL